MKKCFLFFVLTILFLLAVQIDAQNQSGVDFPEVPRVSAYEAYVKYKSGKAIIVQCGGEAYDRRHIVGAFSVSSEGFDKGEIKLPNFPKEGIEIFTYCY
jgi:hypothetical protein